MVKEQSKEKKHEVDQEQLGKEEVEMDYGKEKQEVEVKEQQSADLSGADGGPLMSLLLLLPPAASLSRRGAQTVRRCRRLERRDEGQPSD